MYVHTSIVLVMVFDIKFSEEKNQLLKATRGVGFDEIVDAICAGDLLADIVHPSQKRSNQRVFIVRIKRYVYAVPYVINSSKHEIFLKTAYPSRTLTRKYIKGDDYV